MPYNSVIQLDRIPAHGRFPIKHFWSLSHLQDLNLALAAVDQIHKIGGTIEVLDFDSEGGCTAYGILPPNR
jgi:hypothetical protein